MSTDAKSWASLLIQAFGTSTGLKIAAAILRLILIAVSEVQDWLAEVPYTDIDYRVFSEAAESVALGQSPYEGRTPLLAQPETRYRYSPLLAYVLLPNIWLFRSWGKVLFSACDLLCAQCLEKWLRAHSGNNKHVLLGLALLLFNPFIFTISTRGSMEPMVILLLYSMLNELFLHQRRNFGAVLFGFAVHLRVYPLIYALPLILSVANIRSQTAWRRLMSWQVVQFALISGLTFIAFLIIFSAVYGFEFIQSAYLYHAARVDTKHNFSIYFYPMRFLPRIAGFTLLPQLVGSACLGWVANGMPPVHAMLLQTLWFVATNRVITAQYFVWWFALLPAALPWLEVDFRFGFGMLAWAAAEVHWLAWAYLLEFRHFPVAHIVWIASCIFFAAEVNLLAIFSRRGHQNEDAKE